MTYNTPGVALTVMELLEARADNAVYWKQELEKALAQLKWWQAAIKRGDYVVYVVVEMAGTKGAHPFVYDDNLPPNP